MEWLKNQWFILAFVFAAGGVSAQQEWRIQQLEAANKQAAKDTRTIIRLEEGQKTLVAKQSDVIKKLDLIIELQLKERGQ